MYTLEALYFPTQVILVDDDPAFLEALSNQVSKSFLVKAFSHPKEAIEYLKSTQAHFNWLNPNNLVDEAVDYGERYLSLSKMTALAENKEKYTLSTVVISDYMMPDMNGIEFFEKIADLPVMKILLTANADLDLALYAFNRSIVNKFLVKNSKKLVSEVEESIVACQHGFFAKFSYPILNSLDIPEDSLLRNSVWHKQLETLIQVHDAAECYLIDNIGSYLLITSAGKRLYFICMVNRQFDEYADLAKNDKGPEDLIEKFKNKTHAPVFLEDRHYRLSPKEWSEIVYAFEKGEGYWFCVVD